MNTVFEDKKITVFDTSALEVAYPPLDFAIANWADATTDPTSDRRDDLKHDKTKAVRDFFERISKPVHEITPNDVKSWQIELEKRVLAPATVYSRISRISSFYEWLMKSPDMVGWVVRNPVTLARPKAPKPYRSESTKSLTDDQLRDMVQVIQSRQDVIGRRDLCLFLFYILSGLRRQEIARLIWGDLTISDAIVVRVKLKGGYLINISIDEPLLKTTLLEYIEISGRSMAENDPLWTRFDRAGLPGAQLSSHSIAKRFRVYAEKCGIQGFHIHQLRHSFARIAADESGSIVQVQEALKHKNPATTKVYVQRIGLRKDRFSSRIAEIILN